MSKYFGIGVTDIGRLKDVAKLMYTISSLPGFDTLVLNFGYGIKTQSACIFSNTMFQLVSAVRILYIVATRYQKLQIGKRHVCSDKITGFRNMYMY